MNKLLQRQMERLLGSVEAAPKDLAPLFKAVDDAYDGFDADRRLIERSLDISSEELTAINEQLRREIAGHRQVDAALQESEERFKQVAENAGEWIWEVDLEGRYTYCNPTVEKILGYAPDEVVGKKYFFEFLLPHEREPIKKAIFEGFARRESFAGYVNTNVRKDGSLVVLETNASPVLDPDGRCRGYRGADIDITSRKAAEERQAHLMAQLEKKNQELQDFAHVVSHDLKAPLRGIRTLAEWISQDGANKLSDESREQFGLLVARVNRMQDLIDGILQYSRAGRVNEGRVRIDLGELVAEVIDTLVPPENVAITIEDELPVVELERIRVFEVFQNLLSNAIKYMDKPQGRIRVGCTGQDGFWRFSISDNGPGIEERYFEKIFQLFQTLSPHDDRESTGIGLTVVKKIVEMYGGEVGVESKLGQGSTFFFTLPRTQEETPDERLQAGELSSIRGCHAHHHPLLDRE
jgi:two-component system, LuxR family, sensor kinase FixL